MQFLLWTVLFVVAAFGTSCVAQTQLIQNGNGVPNALPAATNNFTSQSANCGQVELDIFAAGSNGALQDVFQFLTFNNGTGVNFASVNAYNVTLNTAISGGVQIQIILSSLQGYAVTSTGTNGPFNSTTNTVAITLNGATIVQQYAVAGNNFSFTSAQVNHLPSAAFGGYVVNNVSVVITQLFLAQQGLSQNSSCLVQYGISTYSSNSSAIAPPITASAGSSSSSPASSSASSAVGAAANLSSSSTSAGAASTSGLGSSTSANTNNTNVSGGTIPPVVPTAAVSSLSAASLSSLSSLSSLLSTSSGSSGSSSNTSAGTNNDNNGQSSDGGDSNSNSYISGGAIAGIVIGACCWCCLMLLLLNLGLLCGLSADEKGNNAKPNSV